MQRVWVVQFRTKLGGKLNSEWRIGYDYDLIPIFEKRTAAIADAKRRRDSYNGSNHHGFQFRVRELVEKNSK